MSRRRNRQPCAGPQPPGGRAGRVPDAAVPGSGPCVKGPGRARPRQVRRAWPASRGRGLGRLPKKSRLQPFSTTRSENRSSPRSPQSRARATSPGRARPSPREGAFQCHKLLDGLSDLAAIKQRSPSVPKRPPRVGRAPRCQDKMAGWEKFPRQTLPEVLLQQPVSRRLPGPPALSAAGIPCHRRQASLPPRSSGRRRR